MDNTPVVDTPTPTADTSSGAWHETIDWGGGDGFTVPEKVAEFKTPAELAKAYENARTKIASKGILIPKDGEDRTEFETALKQHLGMVAPEKPEEYGWDPPEDLKDLFGDMSERFAELHAAGVDKATAKKILDSEAQGITKARALIQDTQATIAKESEAALKEAWGNDYNDRMAAVNALKERYPDAVEALSAVGLANSQVIIEMMDEVSRSIREVAPEDGSASASQTVQEQIAALKAKPEYSNARMQGHDNIMSQISDLYKKMVK